MFILRSFCCPPCEIAHALHHIVDRYKVPLGGHKRLLIIELPVSNVTYSVVRREPQELNTYSVKMLGRGNDVFRLHGRFVARIRDNHIVIGDGNAKLLESVLHRLIALRVRKPVVNSYIVVELENRLVVAAPQTKQILRHRGWWRASKHARGADE